MRRTLVIAPDRQRGWAFVIVLIALAIVAFLARDAIVAMLGTVTSAPAAESRLPPAARTPIDATQATPVIATPVERARAVDGVVQQGDAALRERIEREAR